LTSATAGNSYLGPPCPLCRTDGGLLVHRIPSLPVHSCLLMDTRDEAMAVPRGSLDLVLCAVCGFLANRVFDESLTAYSSRYEDSQAFSTTFVAYATELAGQWVRDWSLGGRTVVEIGAGRGDFSRMLGDAGAGRVIAMDPTIDPVRFGSGDQRIEPLIRTFRTAADLPACAAVVMRHVLEHVDDPVALLTGLREALAPHPEVPVLVEVPDATRIMTEGAFWDVYYEHCAYLTAATARTLFESCGFAVRRLSSAYDSQYLLVEVTASGTPAPARMPGAELSALRDLATGFGEAVDTMVQTWAEALRQRRAADQRVVVWGAGSKGSAFLVALGEVAAAVDRVIDINPHLTGKFIAGTGHPIVAPADLARLRSDIVVVMNPVYLNEIGGMVAELSPGSDVVALGT
jgi:C-methyltransferase C-terminal domain/Methyltransferase domain